MPAPTESPEQMSLLQRFTSILRSEKKDDEGGRKIPSGFEKILKRTRRGVDHSDKDKEASKSDKKDEEKSQEDKEQETDKGEEPKESKSGKPNKDSTSTTGQLKNFLVDPNGGGPNWENFLKIALIGGITAYYAMSLKNDTEEVTYQTFVQDYLAKQQVEMITLCENKGNSTCKYRAIIDTLDGKKVHIDLLAVENFLYKLDTAQREMGKDPAQFVPVKYGPGIDGSNQSMVNVMIGGMFVFLLFKLYQNMHGKGKGGAGKSGGAGKGPGGFGGGGQMGDLMNMSKSGAQVYGVDKKIRTRFKHVAGLTNTKVEILEFVDFLKDPEKYKKLGAKVPRGALLVGPPGCGKTLLAKAVAGEAGVPFLSISGSDFVQMYVGVGASRVRDLFKQAKGMAPAIIFIDEIDAVAKKRDQKFSSNDERDSTLNQLLVEMDGFTTDESVIVLGATNLADQIDPAIKRPGRFDRQIDINLPTINERKEIYNVHLKKVKVNKEKTRDEYAAKMAALTPGFSGADIANVCNEGAIIAARADEKSVNLKNFEDATERVIGGIEKKLVMTKEERKTVAYHEAGHAIAGWFLEHANPLLKITVIPRSKGSLGFAQYLPQELSLYTKEALIDMIHVALGGRVAEEIFFGKVTTGAGDDIKKCTQIANSLVTVYGMTDNMGLVAYNSGEETGLRAYSDETLHEIDMETKRIVDECYARVKDLLTEKKDLIEALAEELLEKESINLPQIINIIGERPFPMKDSLKEYLTELNDRQRAEEEEKAKKQMEEEAKEEAGEEVDAAEPDLSKASEDTTEEAKTEEKTEEKQADDSTENKKEGEDKKKD